jgi:hypothetical protein
LHGSGIERLMGTIWQPGKRLGKALFDTLKPKAQKALDFSSIYTTSYKDPIFNNVKQYEWIDQYIVFQVSSFKLGAEGKGQLQYAQRHKHGEEVQTCL